MLTLLDGIEVAQLPDWARAQPTGPRIVPRASRLS